MVAPPTRTGDDATAETVRNSRVADQSPSSTDAASGPRPIRQRYVFERRPKTTLVMFSGGIDSTYTLVKLLSDSRDDVIAHHIHLINAEDRHEVEADRCRGIIDYCRREFRDVIYTETAVDHSGMAYMGFDMITVGFEAGIAATSHLVERKRAVDRWAIGTCLEEDQLEGGHWEERLRHIEACCAATCFPNEPPRFFLLPLIPKREEMAYLPRDLLDLTWTCRTPVRTADGFGECGTCDACVRMKALRDQPGSAS